jgi:hypothetical protein
MDVDISSIRRGGLLRQPLLSFGYRDPVSKYSYCKIFVDGMTPEGIKPLLAGLLGGTFERHAMTLGDLEMEVRPNSDQRCAETSADDFAWWPAQVEIEPLNPSGRGSIKEIVTRILEALWAAKARAVAACDFENELPWNGGIELLGIPEQQ